MNKVKDYSKFNNEKFGMLTFTGEISFIYDKRGKKITYGKFNCDCGKEHIARMYSVLHMDTQSCGCVYHEILSRNGSKNILKAIASTIKYNEYDIDGNVVTVHFYNSDKVMLCDLDDWERLKIHCWHVGGSDYAVALVKGENKQIQFHREAMNAPDGVWIDHRDRNRLDCRKSNLREATPLLNAINFTLKRHNTSGYSGVSFDTESNKWRASIRFNNKTYYLGRYHDKQDAINARQIAEDKYFKPILTA